MRIDNPNLFGNLIATGTSFTSLTGSFTGSFTGDGSNLSGVTAEIPANTISGSEQITALGFLTDVPNGTISGSEQISSFGFISESVSSYTALSNIPSGIVSASNQIDLSLATGVASNAVSASYALSASHEITFELSSSHAEVADSVPYSGITGVPTLVSSSVLSSPSQGNVVLTTNGVSGGTIDTGLQTSDHVQFHCIGVGVAASTVLGEIRAAGDITAYYSSDERLKTNITPIQDGLEKIGQIQGYTFDWIPKPDVHSNEGHDIGVIAQQVEEIFPELVITRDTGYKAVKYEKLIPVLIQAINELNNKIKNLEDVYR